MIEQPILKTERLILRPFEMPDAPALHRLVSDWEIAKTTLNIPHPYEVGMAEAWIAAQPQRLETAEAVGYAIIRTVTNELIGSIGLRLDMPHLHASLGYWITKSTWGQGYCTEAARVVLTYGFEIVGLHRIYASHFKSNPASGRVMEKVGMTYEGCLRQHLQRWGKFEDSVQYGILRDEYQRGD